MSSAIQDFFEYLRIGVRVGILAGGSLAVWDAAAGAIVKPIYAAIPPSTLKTQIMGIIPQEDAVGSISRGFVAGVLGYLVGQYSGLTFGMRGTMLTNFIV